MMIRMRALFFGMPGAFSLLALDALLDAGLEPCAVVVPAPRDAPFAVRRASRPPPAGLIPLDAPQVAPSIVSRAWDRGLPVLELARERAPESLAALATLAPDAASVACWPRRIPSALLRLPRHGFLNVHPSLLPAYRGPEPLFWILRDGAAAGVTVHFMDARLDTGDIVVQRVVALPDGGSGADAEALLARTGGWLLAEALVGLASGTTARTPQPAGGTTFGAPQPADFTLEAGWSARRAFNFMRGTAEWGQPYLLLVAGTRLVLIEALAFDPHATLAAPLARDGDVVHIQLTPGVLTARAALAARTPVL
jgi:methionyl-tRNA formyltransferase